MAARVRHERLEARGAEPDAVRVGERDEAVHVAALAEVDGAQGRVGPVREERGEGGVREDLVALEAQLGEAGAVGVDGGEEGVVDVGDADQGEGFEVVADAGDDVDVWRGGGRVVDLEG